MDEQNKVSEEQNIEETTEEVKEQDNSIPESANASESVAKTPAPKAPKNKLPLIIGGIVVGVAAVAVALAIVLGGDTPSNNCVHNWILEHSTATCSEDGYSLYTCSNCNDTKRENTIAYGCKDIENDGYCDKCNSYIVSTSKKAEWISNRYINYIDDIGGFRFCFALKDENKAYISCNATIEMSIVNDYGETVYEGTKYVTTSDYGEWYNTKEKWHGTSVCIYDNEITAGLVEEGTFYYKVIAGNSSFKYSLDIEDLPTYTPTFGAGETWVVDGQWEFTIDSVAEHALCDTYRTENYGFTGMFGIMVKYHYKNLGHSSNFKVEDSNISVYDEETEKATAYGIGIWCDHEKEASSCIVGTKASAMYTYATYNESSVVTIYVSIKDSSGNYRKAQFNVNVTPEEEAPEEDKLDGCKITCNTSLPKTISYYTYSGTKQSSCSVTEVSFEVSGDDLYIYFTGRKTYDSRGSGQSDSCKIGWKLYDNKNNVIASGTAYTVSLATGEGFVKTLDTAFNCITAGGTYYLVLLNTN